MVQGEDVSIDVVFTWVDDRFPGYRDLMARHSSRPVDMAANRTRDNLDLLKYGLRSLQHFAPWVRSVVIVSMRPQVPAWLDTGAAGLRVVHHDEFMPAACLPTFNSFAIVSCLHLIPGLSRRFLYFEDDMLCNAPLGCDDFQDGQGRIRVFPRLRVTTDSARRGDRRLSPWNEAMACSNHLLNHAFGPRRRHDVNHVPLLIDRDGFAGMCARWPEAIAATRRSRFRSPGNVAPEYLYPHHALETGQAVRASLRDTWRINGYAALEDSLVLTRLGLGLLDWRSPLTLTLNDNFGDTPDAGAVAATRRFLDRHLPTPSRFERAAP